MDRFERSLVEQIPRLRRYAWALTGDRERADDLVQDCLARALSRRRLWISSKGMRGWLFTILHNVHVNAVSRMGAAPRAVGTEALEQMPSEGGEAEELQTFREIDRALQRLSPEHRQVVLLVAVEQMPYREAAKVLGVPVGTVMSRLARGRERLRQLLSEPNGVALKRVK